jgi:undecaprenyl-diphosphatase
LRLRVERLAAFLRARLSSEGLFGLHLTIGSVALVASAWLFGGVAEDLITNDPLVVVDVIISDWFRVNATPSLTAKMVLVSAFASTVAVLGLSFAASAFLLWKRRWYELLALAAVVPGGVLLNFLLKIAFARARPSWGDVDLIGFSFPSGHTMSATLFYGLLGVLLALGVKSWWWRATSGALVLVIICAVGFSRIYLGAHYFSDVVAAIAAGAAWLAICLTAVETLRRHRQPRCGRAPNR